VSAGTRRTAVFDAVVALGLAALSLSILAGTSGDTGRMALGVVLALMHVLPLAVRRRWPEQVLVTMVVTGVLFVMAGYPPVALGPAIVVAVYTVAARCPRRRAGVLLGVSTAVMATAVLLTGSGPDTVVANVLVFGVAWLVGDGNRRALESAISERERAAELARTREQLAHQAVTDERLRIARELHDVVAHSMSVIAVQAGTGRVVLERSPELAHEALVAIESTSRTALDEMRRLLNVLRDDRDVPLLSPNPGLGDLDGLVADTVASGLPVRVRVDGERVVLPAGADLAAFRIVQEALTNARRHASASLVSIAVRYEPDDVVIEVVDDGRGGPTEPGGHGIVGMKERAELYGGRVEVGPRPQRGFGVLAVIPYGSGRQ
jgi:signal transduction histidine kinase